MSDRTLDVDPMDSELEHDALRPRLKRVAGRYTGWLAVLAFVLLFLTVFLARDIFITVHSGEVGVMYYRFFGGTQTTRVLGEGQKFVAPWDTMFIYNVRVQETPATIKVLTKEGLTLTLNVSIRFHPELETVGLLHQRVGPNYKEKIVVPEVEMVLSTIMSGLEMHDAYSAGTGEVQKAVNDAIEQMTQDFVKIDDVVLRNVVLPPDVTQAIEDKMAQKVMSESYEYRIDVAKKEADRKEVEANGSRRANAVLDASLTPNILRWKGIEASLELAKSPNAKTLIIGKADGLPLIMNPDK